MVDLRTESPVDISSDEDDDDELDLDGPLDLTIRPARTKNFLTYKIAKKLVKHIDLIVRVLTAIDLVIHVINIFYSLFLGVQRGSLIGLDMNIPFYINLILNFIFSLFSLWTGRVLIDNSYSLPTFTYYSICRILTFLTTITMSISNFVY